MPKEQYEGEKERGEEKVDRRREAEVAGR